MKLPVIPTWVKLLAVAVLVAIVVGAIYAYGQQQFELGEKAERAEWLERENTELVTANARIIELQAKISAREREHAADMAKASATYQENLQHEKAARDRTIADLRSGALRLRIALASRQTAPGGSSGEAGATPGRCDGETRAELSREASEFLVGLASEADDVVHQLTACQVVVVADRKQHGEQQ